MRTLTLATLTAAAALAAGAPALAQATLDELTVTGDILYRNGEPVQMSQRVSYADLDLTVRQDRDLLVRRVRTTARQICDRLGSDPRGANNLGQSCEELAVNDAMKQVRVAFADAGTRAFAAAYPDTYAADASAVVPDTPENRARYGDPLSNAGRDTDPDGN